MTAIQLPFAFAAGEVNPMSEWCQRWTGRRPSWTHRSAGGFDPARYRVEPIAEAVAKSYTLANHYLSSYPAALHRFGLFVDGQDDDGLVGVAVFGAPASSRVVTNVFPLLEPFREAVVLSRLVLEGPRFGAGGANSDAGQTGVPQGRAPGNSESWFLADCFRQLAARGVRGVVAFADPVPRLLDGGNSVAGGHVGHCYQSLNARFTGRATARTVTVLPDGAILNERAKQKVRAQESGHDGVERRLVALGARAPHPDQPPAQWLSEALAAIGCRQARHRGCLRFAWPLGVTRRDRNRVAIALPGLRYPKTPDPFFG